MVEQLVLHPGLGIESPFSLGLILKSEPYGLMSKWATVEHPNVAFKIGRDSSSTKPFFFFFFVAYTTRWSKLILTLERLSQDDLDHWIPRRFINVSGFHDISLPIPRHAHTLQRF